MTKRLTDFSQLTQSMVRKPVEEPKPAPKPKAEDSPVDREAAGVLAYFARPGGNAPQRPHVAPRTDPDKDRAAELVEALEAKDAALDALAEEKAAADERIAELERQLSAEREAHEAAVQDRDRLQGECGRLQGELRKIAENAPVAAPALAAPVAQVEPSKPTRGLLAASGAIAEAFPGEVREQVLSALADSLAAAQQSGRERRAGVLASVLAANPPSGELERRRAELKQILKDAGASLMQAHSPHSSGSASGAFRDASIGSSSMRTSVCRYRRPRLTTAPRRTAQLTWQTGAFDEHDAETTEDAVRTIGKCHIS